MSQTSNKLSGGTILSVTAAALVLVFAPGATTVFAATSTNTSGSAFCTTNLAADTTKINTSVSSLETKLTTARTERTQNVTANYAKWNATLKADQENWAQQRQNEFTKLTAKAQTAAEKTAVQTYETTLTNAINTRETANGVVRTTYQNGVESLIAGQTSTLNSQVATFSNAVTSAEGTAQASCQSTPAQGPTIRLAFIAALKAARQAYVADRQSDSKISSQVQQLAQTRDAAVKANDQTFETAATDAQTTLKTAFGSSSASV